MTSDSTATAMKSFPSAADLPVPEGAEGWEQLYPYYLPFREGDGSESKFWFCDSQHWPTVYKPFETIGGEFAVKCLGQYNTRHLLIPPANGIEFKVHLGYLYMSPVAVAPEDIPARVPEFERRVGHYFGNWERLLDDWKVKVTGTIAEMEQLHFAPLPEMVPFEDIESGKAKDGSEVLMEGYDRLIQLAYQNWQYHFEFLNLGYLAYLDFFTFAKQVFPGIPDQAIAKMVQGVDMELFKPDDELKELATLAVELGLQGAFANTDDVAGTLAAIGALPGGDRWLARYEAAQDPWFNFTVGNGFYGHDKYWNEHQEIPLGYIKDYARRVEEGHSILRPKDALIAERDRIIEEYRSLLDGDNLAAFDGKRASRPPHTPTSRTTTSTLSTGRWASSGARCASSAESSSPPDSGPTRTTSSTSPATRCAMRSSTTSPAGRSAATPWARATGRPRSLAERRSWPRCRRSGRSRRSTRRPPRSPSPSPRCSGASRPSRCSRGSATTTATTARSRAWPPRPAWSRGAPASSTMPTSSARCRRARSSSPPSPPPRGARCSARSGRPSPTSAA
ncbi:hypothetical protein [Leucobacter soli]|uniref:hypothetical protein n=1 Tax=Leucobacter soli TaxID=2812850 RepID=UPI0036154231